MKKFGGMSFGGIYGGGTTIFSKRYKLMIYKDSKTKKWKQVIKKKMLPMGIHSFFLIFPLIDIMYSIVEFKPHLITNFIKWLSSSLKNIKMPIDIPIPSFNIPSWVFDIIAFFIVSILIVFLYFVCFKGVKRWHGCEHKVIASAKVDDLNNAKKYSPIDDRCGGTFLLSIYLSMGFYWFISLYVFKLSVPVGIMSFILLIIIFESRLFHEYNKVGIWFGRLFQKYVTVKEPYDWQLKLGIDGMRKLIDVEYNGKNPEDW